jgi:hypothetical protein
MIVTKYYPSTRQYTVFIRYIAYTGFSAKRTLVKTVPPQAVSFGGEEIYSTNQSTVAEKLIDYSITLGFQHVMANN